MPKILLQQQGQQEKRIRLYTRVIMHIQNPKIHLNWIVFKVENLLWSRILAEPTVTQSCTFFVLPSKYQP